MLLAIAYAMCCLRADSDLSSIRIDAASAEASLLASGALVPVEIDNASELVAADALDSAKQRYAGSSHDDLLHIIVAQQTTIICERNLFLALQNITMFVQTPSFVEKAT